MTKRIWALAATLALSSTGAASAQDSAAPAAVMSRLEGVWTVDLTTDPAEPYMKAMHLALRSDGRVEGDFYDSDIQAGRWKARGDRICVSFRTTDGVGPYHTAACTSGDKVEGQTWAEHRNFVFVWTATRGAPPR